MNGFITDRKKKRDITSYQSCYDKNLINEEYPPFKKDVIENIKANIVAFIIFEIIFGIIFAILGFGGNGFLYGLPIIVIGFPLSILLSINNGKAHGFKRVVIKKWLATKFVDGTYNPDGTITPEEYNIFAFHENYDTFNSKDAFKIPFKASFMKLNAVETKGIVIEEGIKYRNVLFNGLFGTFKVKNVVSSPVYFCNPSTNVVNAVKINNEELAKNYVIFSTNVQDVTNILSANKLNKLLEIKKLIPTIEFVFVNDLVYFRFQNDDILPYKKTVKSSSLELAIFEEFIDTFLNFASEIDAQIINQ